MLRRAGTPAEPRGCPHEGRVYGTQRVQAPARTAFEHETTDDVRPQCVRALVGERLGREDAERDSQAHDEQPAREQDGAEQDALTEEQPDEGLDAEQQLLHQKIPPARMTVMPPATPIHNA